ncbi:hypothetical protein BDR07DRAFT_1231597, partial [Suillus spraguei]
LVVVLTLILTFSLNLGCFFTEVNNTRKWQDQNKILPHGALDIIFQSPENFGALDFKIKVDCEALDHIRGLYIDPSHVVFDLVPQPFSA